MTLTARSALHLWTPFRAALLLWAMMPTMLSISRGDTQDLWAPCQCPHLPLTNCSLRRPSDPSRKSYASHYVGSTSSNSSERNTSRDRQQLSCGSIDDATNKQPPGTSSSRWSDFCHQGARKLWNTCWQPSGVCFRTEYQRMINSGWRAWHTPSSPLENDSCRRYSGQSTMASWTQEARKAPRWWPPPLWSWHRTSSTSHRFGSCGRWSKTRNACEYNSGYTGSRLTWRRPRLPLAATEDATKRRWRRWRMRPTPQRRRRRTGRRRTPPRRGPALSHKIESALYILYRTCLIALVGCGISALHHFSQHPPNNTEQGHLGPKSKGNLRFKSHSIAIVMYCIFCSISIQGAQAIPQVVDARVGSAPHQELPEVEDQDTHRLHGLTNLNGEVPQSAIPQTRPKRAFLRAQRRATKHGGTMYKGRWMDAHQLGVQYSPVKQAATASFAPKHRPRIHYMSWNASSLSSPRNVELHAWLNSPAGQHLDIVAVQETHWRGPLEYRKDRFLALHSGTQKAEAGLLALINTHTFPVPTIQHTELIPGRLMHVKLEAEPCIHVVIIYQHMWSITRQARHQTHSQETVLSRRMEVWMQLTALLSRLPQRDQVLLLGDFNTSLTTEGSLVGRGISPHRKQHASDRHIFQDLLRNLGLTALNTWSKGGRRACTHYPASQTGHSQIDYAVARINKVDQVARQVRPHALPFVPTTGMRHLPLYGSLPKPSVPRGHRNQRSLRRWQVVEAYRRSPELLPVFQQNAATLVLLQPHLPINQVLEQSWIKAQARAPEALSHSPQTANSHLPTVSALWKQRRLVSSCRTNQFAARLFSTASKNPGRTSIA